MHIAVRCTRERVDAAPARCALFRARGVVYRRRAEHRLRMRPRVASVIPQRWSTGTSRQRTTRSRHGRRHLRPPHRPHPRPLVADEQHEEPSCGASRRGAERVAEEPARDRQQDPRAVTCLFVRGERAAVPELRESLETELHHAAVGTTRDVCHESDPARVPLDGPVGPGASARGEPSVERRHGSPSRLRSERTTYSTGVSRPFRAYERCVTSRGGGRDAIGGTSHSRYARYTASQLRLHTLAR
jgi:hypothetical protein